MENEMEIEVFRTSFSYFQNQCYLIYDRGKGVLIDPAWNPNVIDNFIMAERIEVTAVLVTHGHKDHTHLAQYFAVKYGCSVYMSSVEINHSEFRCSNLTGISDQQEIDGGTFAAIPLLTPGHTPGGMCYLIGDHLFTGDTFFIEGVGTCDSDKPAAGELFESVQKIKAFVSMTSCFWPGHSFGKMPGQPLSYLLDHNIYFQLNNREDFIKFRTRKNRPNPIGFM